MQTSLFEAETQSIVETVDEVNREVLEKAEALFPGKVFIFGQGKPNANVLVVGESPGPHDIATRKPFSGPAEQIAADRCTGGEPYDIWAEQVQPESGAADL